MLFDWPGTERFWTCCQMGTTSNMGQGPSSMRYGNIIVLSNYQENLKLLVLNSGGIV